MSVYLILMFLLASFGVYVFIRNKGFTGYICAMIIVGAFLCLVYLTKLVILL